MNKQTNKPEWAEMLKDIIALKGTLSKCYSTFHNFSIGNQVLAMSQLQAKGLPLSPIANYNDWKKLGRQVQKGQKALALIMPVTFNKKDEEGNKTDEIRQSFVLRNYWFSLDQTDGTDYNAEPVSPHWDAEKANQALEISEIRFDMTDGNCQGYATAKSYAINPVATLPHKTRFHEMAHIVLGHTLEHTMTDSERTPKDIREVEAESVAYILCSILELPGLEESRGYVQHWISGAEISEKSARRIFAAADKILKAGK